MDDRNELHRTFDEWEKAINSQVAAAKAQGVILEPVSFDLEKFIAFCRSNNLPCGDRARAQFAANTGKAKSSN